MKRLFNSMVISFAMYSKIPMPKVEWSKENMKYTMCFFPLIGVIIGILMMLWDRVSNVLEAGEILKTAVFLLIPILITGGIHLDGFLDTADALSSYKSREEKLEILKDPHIGAFAIIVSIVYFLLAFGVWSEADQIIVRVAAVGFMLSRAYSGLSVASFKLAKNTGLVSMFSNASHKKITKIIMVLYILIASGTMIYLHPVFGVVCAGTAFCVFFYYRVMSTKNFGGITGDLAGYFLQICELTMVLSLIICKLILRG
jgi:adenosylcobinamide-GDP ribazoletransferase